MCGIAGMIDARGLEPDPAVLRRMASVIRHRGPDDEGWCVLGAAGLAHRRLSIIDLEGGHQPLGTPDGALQIVFNGEIYNFPEVRRELESRGVTFRTRSDTEVLLRAYEIWDVDALRRLNGMFAFAIWDGRRRRLFAARDRMGKKPLVYYHHDGRFVFGSEIKAILAAPDVDRSIDEAAIHEYLRSSVIAAPRTAFRHVRKLPAAHYLLLEEGTLAVRRYWSPPFGAALPPVSEDEYLEGLADRFRRAVERRLISDVPLGALLSGGLDSSAVVGTMAQLASGPVRTYSIGFEEAAFSELEDARAVARHFGTDHHELIVRPSAAAILPDLVWHFDEPFGDSSAVPTWYVSQMAARHVKVVLSGDGGDELFAGYTRYLPESRRERFGLVPRPVRRRVLQPLERSLPLGAPGRNTLYALAHHSDLAPGYGLGPYPYIRERLLAPEFEGRVAVANGGAGDPDRPDPERLRALDVVTRLQYLDTIDYLPNDILIKVDRTSMAHSLEVRSPLLDYELVEYAAGLPTRLKLGPDGTSKVLFRRLCARFLPESALRKPKQGFGIPKGLWFREGLRDRAQETLLDRRTLARGYFRPEVVKRILEYHASGQRDYGEWIWNLLVLEEWHRVFVDPDTRRL